MCPQGKHFESVLLTTVSPAFGAHYLLNEIPESQVVQFYMVPQSSKLA